MNLGEYLRRDPGGYPAMRRTWAVTLTRPDGSAGERRRFVTFIETGADQAVLNWNEELFDLARHVRDEPMTFEQWVTELWSPRLDDPIAAHRLWTSSCEMRGSLLIWLDTAPRELRRDFEQIDAP